MDYRTLGLVLVVLALTTTPGVAGATLQEAQSQQQGVCDYASLYDETIGSVVAVQTPVGQGSGFVYETGEENNSTYIVTNAHVVGQAETVGVQFVRGEVRRGTVVGQDEFADLAVVRVTEMPGYAEPLPVADSPAQPGTAVAAFGNPFGLEQTVTHGIVSGTNRTLPTTLGFTIPNVVQTDAPINPGNSGGPLVDCEGTVVGVNTAGISGAQAENVGFAVSASLIRAIVPSLIETGKFEHGFLGVSLAAITPAIMAANDLNVTEGAYVVSVAATAPADDGLRGASEFAVLNGTRVPVGGDVIVAVEDQPISSPEDLTTYLFLEGQPGETVTLTVIRDGERRAVNVTLGERPQPTPVSGRP